MKKLLSLVLVCAMGLGMVSCVESEESPSVEAIRNAKAEQLKALSNLYNAQAEAEKTIANAEAALLNAKAEYKKEMTKEAAEKFAVEIEKIKAEAEAAILKAQKEAAEYENEILAQADRKMTLLYSQYTAYVNQLARASKELVSAKVSLASQQDGLVSTKEAAEATVAAENAKIAQYEAELAVLTASDLANAEDIDVDSLNVEKQKAFVAYNEAYAAWQANEVKAYNDAREAYMEASTEYSNNYDEIRGKYVREWYENGQWNTENYNVFSTFSYRLEDGETYEYKVVIDETELQEWKNYVATVSDYYYTQEGLEAKQEALADAQEAAEEAAEAVLEAQADSAAVNAYVAQLQTAVETKDAAVKTLTAAWVKYNDLGNLVAAEKTAKEAVKTAEAAEKTAKEAAEKAAKAVTAAEKALADAKTLEPKMAEHKAAIKAAADAVTAAEKVEATAKKAYDDAVAAETKVNADAKATDVQKAQAALATANAKAAYAAETAKVEAAKAEKTAVEKAFEAWATTNKLTGTAEQVIKAIEDAIAKAEVALHNAQVDAIAKNEAYADAQSATATAKAAAEEAVVDSDAITAAFVAAVAPAKEAEAALVALLKNDLAEDLGIASENGCYHVEYAKGKTAGPKQTVDANGDGVADFAQSNGVFTEDLAIELFNHTNITTNLADVKATAKAAVEGAEKDLADAEYDVLEAKDNLTWYERNFNNVQNGIPSFEMQWKNDSEAMEAELRAQVDSLTADKAAVQALSEARWDANEAMWEAYEAVEALYGEYDAILKLLAADNSNDITKAIKDLEKNIATAKAAIAAAENVLNGSDYDSVEYKEAMLAIQEANVADLEARVEYLTSMVQAAKAKLDAAVAAQQAE